MVLISLIDWNLCVRVRTCSFKFQPGYEDSNLVVDNNDRTVPEANVPERDVENGVVYPLSRNHLELFTKMSGHTIRTTIRTDTVSTILEQDTEYDLEHHEEQGQYV